ncbi:MAG TPA: hypothetical protein PK095_07440 [Myxococcota bacterium]|nr:hypothetical protein [Myxococcota bacterium]
MIGRLLVPVLTAAAPTPTVAPSSTIAIRCYESDDSVFVGGSYLINGLPGRILRWILEQHLATGRVDFTNRELRLELAATEPWIADNLESRLVLLRRRLDEKSAGLGLVHVGRGRLRLRLDGPLTLEVESAAPA